MTPASNTPSDLYERIWNSCATDDGKTALNVLVARYDNLRDALERIDADLETNTAVGSPLYIQEALKDA